MRFDRIYGLDSQLFGSLDDGSSCCARVPTTLLSTTVHLDGMPHLISIINFSNLGLLTSVSVLGKEPGSLNQFADGVGRECERALESRAVFMSLQNFEGRLPIASSSSQGRTCIMSLN